MTTEIYLGIAGLDHMTKQPQDRRYALFCAEALKDACGIDCEIRDCEIRNRGGHIGDYKEYTQARRNGLDHFRSVVIRFYPDLDNRRPSDDFLEDLRSLICM